MSIDVFCNTTLPAIEAGGMRYIDPAQLHDFANRCLGIEHWGYDYGSLDADVYSCTLTVMGAKRTAVADFSAEPYDKLPKNARFGFLLSKAASYFGVETAATPAEVKTEVTVTALVEEPKPEPKKQTRRKKDRQASEQPCSESVPVSEPQVASEEKPAPVEKPATETTAQEDMGKIEVNESEHAASESEAPVSSTNVDPFSKSTDTMDPESVFASAAEETVNTTPTGYVRKDTPDSLMESAAQFLMANRASVG